MIPFYDTGLSRHEYSLAQYQMIILQSITAFSWQMNKGRPARVGGNFHAKGTVKFQSYGAVFWSLPLLSRKKGIGGIDCPSLPFLLDGFHTELKDHRYFNTSTQQSRGVPSVSLGDELGHCHLLLTIILLKSLLPRAYECSASSRWWWCPCIWAISETLRWMFKNSFPLLPLPYEYLYSFMERKKW